MTGLRWVFNTRIRFVTDGVVVVGGGGGAERNFRAASFAAAMMTGATPAFGAADHIKGNGERKEQKKEGKQTRSDAATPVLCVGGSRVSKIVGPPRRSFHLESHQRVVWTVPRSASVHAIQACSHRPIFADGSPPPQKKKKMRETVFFLSSLSPGFTSGLVVGLNQPIG